MITLSLWKTIITYIENVKKTLKVDGVLICGSLPNNKFQKGSDVDLLFLANNEDFSMETILFENIIFDTMIASTSILKDILLQQSIFSDVLSLSFGQTSQIIDESDNLRCLLGLSKKNIVERELSYQRTKDKEPHVFDEIFYTQKIDGIYRLLKDGKTVL